MAIKKYTNIDDINNKTQNVGQYLQAEDLFIVSKNEIEETDFGECKYDVMEVSIYDINNNLLPHKSGNNVAYIKTGDIKNYMYNITNKGGQKELAINAEKLLNDLGFTNGILKININFVRYRVGSENELERVWIQEISPSREEIRIVPLKTKDSKINEKTNKEFLNLQNLNKDFKYYRKSLINSIDSFEGNFLDSIDSTLETQFGKDFFNIVRKDFGLSRFDNIRKKIYEDFKQSVTYYLNNRYYDIRESNYGRKSEIRFEDCEQYDFGMLTSTIKTILFDCIEYNLQFLKRRNIDVKVLPKEFAVTELRKQIANNLESFPTPETKKRNVYSPDKVDIKVDDKVGEMPIKPLPPVEEIKIDPPVLMDVIVPPPVEVVVTPTFPTFEYTLKDKSPFNGRSVVKFVDADGVEVQKEIGFGKTITICARENTISNAEKTKPSFLGKLLGKKDTINPKLPSDLKITKGKPCNKVDIGPKAPTKQRKIGPRFMSGGFVKNEGLFGNGNRNIEERGGREILK